MSMINIWYLCNDCKHEFESYEWYEECPKCGSRKMLRVELTEQE